MRWPVGLVAGLTGAAVLTLLSVHAVGAAERTRTAERHPVAQTIPAPPPTPTIPPTPPPSVPAPPAAAPPDPAAIASARIAALVAGLPAGSVSIAVDAPATGGHLVYGATSGMIAASVAKVQLLETLLLQERASGTLLNDDEDSDATAMIEDSDNDAAQDIYQDDGDTAGILAADPALGISPATTVPGPEDQWGLTSTSASDQVQLLADLISPSSPLDAAERAYALNLLQNVDSGQRWGAPVAADAATTFAVKDGWLSVDAEDGLWAVNSDAIITVHGTQVLISVLTQHNGTEQDGIDLVQALASVAAPAVL